jgi:NADPH2:quinone reductase
LIHGASGGVGIAAVQLARRLGMIVIGGASTETGRAYALTHGARHVIDHSGPDAVEETMRHTNGRGVDVIVEMLANKNLRTDLALLTKRGRVIVVGSRGSVEVDMREAMMREAMMREAMMREAMMREAMMREAMMREAMMREAMMREASVQGMLLSNATDDELQTIHAALFAMLSAGGIRPVVGRQFTLREATEAHEALLTRRDVGKLVLIP